MQIFYGIIIIGILQVNLFILKQDRLIKTYPVFYKKRFYCNINFDMIFLSINVAIKVSNRFLIDKYSIHLGSFFYKCIFITCFFK